MFFTIKLLNCAYSNFKKYVQYHFKGRLKETKATNLDKYDGTAQYI